MPSSSSAQSTSNSASGSDSRSSSSSSSYAGPTGAGGNSTSSATSPSGATSSSEQASFVPGATSASANASATATAQSATTSATVSVPVGEQKGSAQPTKDSQAHDSDEEPDIGDSVDEANETSQTTLTTIISLLLGTPEGSLLVSTHQQDIFWGGSGADIFQLSAIGVTELSQADIILDYSRATGDYLTLGKGLNADDLMFEVVDFSSNSTVDSTVVRSSIDNTILAVVPNTVNESGETLLSTADFLDAAAVETWVASNPSLELEPSGSSQTSSSSSTYVDDLGTGSSSSATATSATGETATSSESVYSAGAALSGGSSTATANLDGVNTTASAQAPLLDVLIGTAESDVIVGTDSRTIFIGNGGADIFVLSATKKTSLETADIIVDFSPEQGDQIRLPSGIAFSDITLQTVDIDSNGTFDGTRIDAIATGAIYAVALNTVDIFGTSTLAADSFITPDFT